MVVLAFIIPTLQPQDWFTSLHLKDMSIHVVFPVAHRKYLRFTVGLNHYHHKVLPVGFFTAP